MTKSLDEIEVNIDDFIEPTTSVVCIMRSGSQIKILTPLSPEDVMTLWNSKNRVMRIPAGDRSYAVIKKRCVDFLHTFIPTK